MVRYLLSQIGDRVLMVGGVIVVGEQTIAYFSMTLDTFRCVVPQPTIFESYAPVGSDPEEWILGDAEGRIYSLTLQNQELTFTKIGEVLPPSENPFDYSPQFPQHWYC